MTDKILDYDENVEDVAPVVYEIASYGVDYDVDGLVKRLEKGDVFIPPFQRDYVWNQVEASRLVESLLLGLPVPGVFLAKEQDSNKLYVIDGQQRLKSLQFFFSGYFNPKPEAKTKRVFKLKGVQEKYEGVTYETLEEEDRVNLENATIHATIIKQESPKEDNTSIYHVFERLNTGGRKLTPQEIRSAIYIGKLNELIYSLNDYPSWRELFGKKNIRLKDQELILRFLAVYYERESYEKPMKEFLNKFNQIHRNPSQDFLEKAEELFKNTTDVILSNVGKSAFRPEKVFNTNAFEAIMVAVANRIEKGESDFSNLSNEISELFKNTSFFDAITRATSDESVIKQRHEIVQQYI